MILPKPKPDIERFKKIILGQIIPETPPLAELFLDDAIIKAIGEEVLGLQWITPTDRESRKKYRDFKLKYIMHWGMTIFGYMVTRHLK